MNSAVSRTRLLQLALAAAAALLGRPTIGDRTAACTLARAALGPQSRPAVLRRPPALCECEPRRRGPRHRLRRLLARPSRDRPARGRSHGAAEAHDRLADGAVLRRGLSPALVAPERGDRGRLLRDAADGRGRERQPEDVRRSAAGDGLAVDDPGRADPRRRGCVRQAQLRAARAGPADDHRRRRAHHAPVPRLRHGGGVHRPHGRDARRVDRPARLVRLVAEAVVAADDRGQPRRVGQRCVRRQADHRRRPGRLRAR